ncbi:putative metal-dependent hydrolase [Paenibacillus alginolyticus]|uniref:YfiT family bacillithiol transferase n=1 Tax=Paenibacillus alginolyticus TaxID=59839 RepID=UPI000FD785DB|nr:putative metal-dependent hydrolase [Paenibacillus alginolyticus]MCY9670849.1 putative metal-dependent hydrolase [Paenibacillus alginolyticus]
MHTLRYPIGQFTAVQEPTEEQRKQFIESITVMTDKLRHSVEGLGLEQLNTPYRPGGWTLQQVVHHLADAEMNAYIRFKRGLTEEHPVAGTFREDLWAELNDYKDTPLETSILILEALHSRFVTLLVKLKTTDFKRSVTSPTHGDMTLDVAVQRYSWHSRHHIAQITSLRERMGW